jgi:hypothetical protein
MLVKQDKKIGLKYQSLTMLKRDQQLITSNGSCFGFSLEFNAFIDNLSCF